MYVYYHTIMYPDRLSYQYQNFIFNNLINIVYLPQIVVICLARPKELSSEMIYLRILADLLVMWCVMETSVLGVFSQRVPDSGIKRTSHSPQMGKDFQSCSLEDLDYKPDTCVASPENSQKNLTRTWSHKDCNVKYILYIVLLI